MTLADRVEAILFYRNEPVEFKELSRILGVDLSEIKTALETLRARYSQGGIVLIATDTEASFGTNPELAPLITDLQKEELSREIGRAGLETLAIVLYKGPVSRREIDYIRGVNSGFILRNLLVRGLVERTEIAGERSYSYKPTLELMKHLGLRKKEDLPEYATAFSALNEFVSTQKHNEDGE